MNEAQRAELALPRNLSVLPAAMDGLLTPILIVSTTAAEPLNPRVFWVNRVFARSLRLDTAAIYNKSLWEVSGEIVIVEGGPELAEAIVVGRRARTRLQIRSAEGVEVWWDAILSPQGEYFVEGTGSASLCLIQFVDVTSEFEDRRHQLAAVVTERRSRQALLAVSKVSDYLADLDHPFVLGNIASLVVEHLGGWAGFYLDDGGLRYCEGLGAVGADSDPIRGGARHANRDALGDSFIAGVGTRVIGGPDITEVQDPVQALLQGRLESPVVFDVDARYMGGTISRELAKDLNARLQATGKRYSDVQLHAIPSRDGTMGILAAVMPLIGEDTVIAGDEGFTDRAAGWNVRLEEGLSVLELITRRVGMAIENVQLYRREHALAETLQRAMLPEQTEIPGLDVWSYYAPTSEHAQVGGDWYDVMKLEDDTVGLAIGDVVGHDIEAAAIMGQLRSILRAYAFELSAPGTVLKRVDDLVVGMRMSRPASLVYATLVPTESGWDVAYCRAGHLPPLRIRSGEVTLLDASGGSLIGYGRGNRRTATADLVPGDVLLFYTDGLIERRARGLKDGLDELICNASGIQALDAAGIGEELLNRLDEELEDDVALVVVRVPDPNNDARRAADSPRTRRWTFPSEPASIARARHAVLSACSAWEMFNVADAELVASELVANAVLHGWGYMTFRLQDTGSGLRIEVEDANPSPPVPTEGHPNRSGGYGMQIVDRLAEWGWEPKQNGQGKTVWAQLTSA